MEERPLYLAMILFDFITILEDRGLVAVLVISTPSANPLRPLDTVICLVETDVNGILADKVICPESTMIGPLTELLLIWPEDNGKRTNLPEFIDIGELTKSFDKL